MTGGEAIMTRATATRQNGRQGAVIVPRRPRSASGTASAQAASPRAAEADELQRLSAVLDAYAAEGLQGAAGARVERRGLVVRLLTDKLLFDCGLADSSRQGRR